MSAQRRLGKGIEGCLCVVHFLDRFQTVVLRHRKNTISRLVVKSKKRELRGFFFHPCDASGKVVRIKLASCEMHAAVMRGDSD